MNYCSTRGSISGVTASQAIRLGIAPDGGLFTPETIPLVSLGDLQKLRDASYQELATAILALYLTDYPLADLDQMVQAAYAHPAKFDHPEIAPVVKLQDGQYIIELWHGPTCAFKDVALQLLPYLMTKASLIAGDSTEIIILVATSGDTGKAALEGFKDVPGTKIIVFFPEQGVSQIQRMQMVTQEGNNTFVVGVKGNFDDAQNGVKRIFTDPALADLLRKNNQAFSSANSINWGRLAPQIIYYFYSYLQLCREGSVKLGDKVNITVPTGNFGNILAAYFAKRMGLPVGRFICASNSNNVLTDFLRTGVYDRKRQFYTTISPSMDILISSNLERLLYYLTDCNPGVVNEWMAELQTNGRYEVDAHTKSRIQSEFYGGFASEAETMATIQTVFKTTGQVLDTHTAVGKVVCDRYQQETGDTTRVLLAATASPFKFNSSVLAAISGPATVANTDEFTLLHELQELSGLPIPAGLKGLEQMPVRHRQVCEKDEMDKTVMKLLGI